MTPLILAIKKKDQYFIRELVNKGANPNVFFTNFDGNNGKCSLLYLSIEKDNKEVFDVLLSSSKIEVGLDNEDGETPLLLAYRKENLYFMKELINRGANVNVLYPIEFNNKKYPLIHSAILKNNEEMVKVLLSSKTIDVELEDVDKKRPFILAYEQKHLKLMELLIEKGATVNLLIAGEKYPLLHSEVLKNNEQMVKVLLKSKSVRVDLGSNYETPLFFAYKNRNLNIMKQLIDKEADVNIPYSVGDFKCFYTLLYLALDNDDEEVSMLLLKKKNLNYPQGPSKMTPLQLAIMKKYYPVVDKMLEQTIPTKRIWVNDFRTYYNRLDSAYEALENLKDHKFMDVLYSFKQKNVAFLVKYYTPDEIIRACK